MSYEDLLIHECDIYHLKVSEKEGKYGIPSKDLSKEYYYSDEPDHSGVSCYFAERSQTLTQNSPDPRVIQSFLVHFEVDQDVRVNDKVIRDGIKYKLNIPNNIRGHHVEVIAVRDDSL